MPSRKTAPPPALPAEAPVDVDALRKRAAGASRLRDEELPPVESGLREVYYAIERKVSEGRRARDLGGDASAPDVGVLRKLTSDLATVTKLLRVVRSEIEVREKRLAGETISSAEYKRAQRASKKGLVIYLDLDEAEAFSQIAASMSLSAAELLRRTVRDTIAAYSDPAQREKLIAKQAAAIRAGLANLG